MKIHSAFTLAVLLLLFITGCHHQDGSEKAVPEEWITFEWAGDSIGNSYYEKPSDRKRRENAKRQRNRKRMEDQTGRGGASRPRVSPAGEAS